MSGVRVRPLEGSPACEGRMTVYGALRPCKRRATVRVYEEGQAAAALCGLHMRSAMARDSLAGVLWQGAE